MAKASGGSSLQANLALLANNARLAGEIAVAFAESTELLKPDCQSS